MESNENEESKNNILNKLTNSSLFSLFNNKSNTPSKSNLIKSIYGIYLYENYNKEDSPYLKIEEINKFTHKKREPLKENHNELDSLLACIEKNKRTSFPIQSQSNLQSSSKTIHPSWKLYRVISGHNGWVRCIDIDPSNDWFVSGSSDCIIKFWDLASGKLKLSLTGHISTVRDVKISHLSPYLFSCSEDRKIKCWDLEQNRIIKDFHGHLSSVYTISCHNKENIIASGGRDCTIRVWDIRSKNQVGCIEGHSSSISQVIMRENRPEIVSSSHDSTIKLIDIRTMKAYKTFTNHKKAVRSIGDYSHNEESYLVSSGCDNTKVWDLNRNNEEFLYNLHRKDEKSSSIMINTLSINSDLTAVEGSDCGKLIFWDLKTKENYQIIHVPQQKGSIQSESSIFSSKFDYSSSRLITAECDKTIKMWKKEEV